MLVQVAAVGWSAWAAAGAARAAARAELIGGDAEAAAEAALPGPLADRAEVERAGERMRVEVRAPRLLPLLPAIEVGASAGLDPLASTDGAEWRWSVISRTRLQAEGGQAQVELVAVIPIAVCLAVVILQLLAVGYSQSLADGAAEAGAYALAAGLPADEAALAASAGLGRRERRDRDRRGPDRGFVADAEPARGGRQAAGRRLERLGAAAGG